MLFLRVLFHISLVATSTLALSAPSKTQTSRRGFLGQAVSFGLGGAVVATTPFSSWAAPEILTAANGKIKYATLQPALEKPSSQKGDVVAIEYTGYLSDGTIFDATHAQGKKNVLMFQVGGNAVIPGVSEMVEQMGVGQKVQAIVSEATTSNGLRPLFSQALKSDHFIGMYLFWLNCGRFLPNWLLETRDFALTAENVL